MKGTMNNAVELLGTDLKLKKGARVIVNPADNMPDGRGDFFVSPINGSWEDDSILVDLEDVCLD